MKNTQSNSSVPLASPAELYIGRPPGSNGEADEVPVGVPVKTQAGRSRRRAFKYAQIKTDLSIQILEGRMRPHDRLPSLNEMVEKYHVSKITARRVLKELVAEGLVYATRGSGSFVADAASRGTNHGAQTAEGLLGVVFAHAWGAFMSDIILGIDEEAYARNAQIALCVSNNSYEREAKILQRLASQGVSRILVFMVLKFDSRVINPNIPLYLRLQDRGIRLLFVVCNLPGVPLPSITYDEYDAFRRVVKLFKDKGLRRLACLLRNDNASSTIMRLRGFKEGLLENGLPFDEDHVSLVPIESHDTVVSDTARHVAPFLRGHSDVEGIVCADEVVAGGVFEAFELCRLQGSDRPVVGGMGIVHNLHILKGHPYILLEEGTRRIGREAAAIILGKEFPRPGETDTKALQFRVPVPMKIPKRLR